MNIMRECETLNRQIHETIELIEQRDTRDYRAARDRRLEDGERGNMERREGD